MIRIEDICLSFNDFPVLDQTSGYIEQGELVALLGMNGSGKSTLLNALMGWRKSNHGRLIIDGRNVDELLPSERASTVAIVLSRLPSLPLMSVLEAVSVGVSQERNNEKVMGWLKFCGVTNFAERKLDTLSDGQLQRVMIARALCQETPVLLMDEPLSHLDHPSKLELMLLLQQLKNMGKTILFSTHDVHYLSGKVDKVWMLKKGKIETFQGKIQFDQINWES